MDFNSTWSPISVSQQLAGREKVIQSKDEQIQRKEGENRSKDDKIQQLQRSLDTRMEQIQALQILRHSELIQSQETGIVKLEQQREETSTYPRPVKQPEASKPAKTPASTSPTKQPKASTVIWSNESEIESRDDTIHSKDDEIRRLQSSLQALQMENQGLRRQIESESPDQTTHQLLDQTATTVQRAALPLQREMAKRWKKRQIDCDSTPRSQVQRQPLTWPLPLKWQRGKDMIDHGCTIFERHTVLLNGMVYVGGSETTSGSIVQQYSPDRQEWSLLPEAHVRGFGMTSLNGQLVLVGNHGPSKDRLTVWDSGHGEWAHPYPPMPTGRSMSAAVGYHNYLIVACGWEYRDTVEVLDSSSGRWYSAEPLPVGGYIMSSVVVGDRWYLSSFGYWKDIQQHIFWAHLPTLISCATLAANTNTAAIWQELPTPPVDEPTLLALQGHLLLVGGRGCVQELHRYDLEASQWRECGQVPVGLYGPSCTVLPSGELIVAGGLVEDIGYSYQMWLGKIEC